MTWPFDTVAVAVAVLPIPTNTFSGDWIPISTVPEYPEPASVMVNALTVPAAETVAVAAAETALISPDVIRASTSVTVIPE